MQKMNIKTTVTSLKWYHYHTTVQQYFSVGSENSLLVHLVAFVFISYPGVLMLTMFEIKQIACWVF